MRDEIRKIIGFWMELGLDGFRVDAVPYLISARGVGQADAEGYGDPHEHLRELKAFMGRRRGDAILLGEVNIPYQEQLAFFGSEGVGEELTMQFDFVLMQQMYLAFARNDATLIRLFCAQPRRTHPRQAQRGRTPGGLRGIRARPRHATLRAGTAATTAADGGRRPSSAADDLLPDVLAAGHTRAVLRRGDRHG
ncbi:alpha amylase [Mycobacteroides abscessus subsp. abscessus]|nr:alpha amylase [Mycobacteroides abscessus subsp. abscessus]